MTTKPRIATRLSQAIGASEPTVASPDLKDLTTSFGILKGRLRTLVAALTGHHDSMIQINQSRNRVARAIGDLSEKSPIYMYAGAPSASGSDGGDVPMANAEAEGRFVGGSEDAGGASTASVDDPPPSTASYASVHGVLSSRHEMYTERYLRYIVEYAVEWEAVVVNKITSSLKKADDLRVDLDHYQAKVESISQSIRGTTDRGKPLDPSIAEKLRRNEDKLQRARNEYESFVSSLCVLLEEVTSSSWKDLQPLLIKIIQFDWTLNEYEAMFLQSINGSLDGLEEVASKYGLDVNAQEGPGVAKCRRFDEAIPTSPVEMRVGDDE